MDLGGARNEEPGLGCAVAACTRPIKVGRRAYQGRDDVGEVGDRVSSATMPAPEPPTTIGMMVAEKAIGIEISARAETL